MTSMKKVRRTTSEQKFGVRALETSDNLRDVNLEISILINVEKSKPSIGRVYSRVLLKMCARNSMV